MAILCSYRQIMRYICFSYHQAGQILAQQAGLCVSKLSDCLFEFGTAGLVLARGYSSYYEDYRYSGTLAET